MTKQEIVDDLTDALDRLRTGRCSHSGIMVPDAPPDVGGAAAQVGIVIGRLRAEIEAEGAPQKRPEPML